MKKLFAIAVVFALVAGTAFAMDVGGTVFGHVNFLEGDSLKETRTDDHKIFASGGMDRLRIDGGGEAMEGKFGGYIRIDGGIEGHAWWKPLDLLKFTIGKNVSDGIWGKEGVTGWSFNQMPYDCGVAVNTGIWGTEFYAAPDWSKSRWAFFGGFGGGGALLEVKPIDILSVNIAIPFIDDVDNDGNPGGKAADVFSRVVGQVDVNIGGVGNIALTYTGEGRGYIKDGNFKGSPIDEPTGSFFLYYGGNFGALGIDFGLGYHLADKHGSHHNQPLGLGLGVKFAASDQFGIKFRTVVAIPGEKFQEMNFKADLLPYFALNDNMCIFLNTGLNVTIPSEDEQKINKNTGDKWKNDPTVGFVLNPYLRVGAEWGPTFYVGFQLYTDGIKTYKGGDTNKPDPKKGDPILQWAIPIALQVSF